MNVGDVIIVIPSFRLYEMQLGPLVRHNMKIKEIVVSENGKITGCVASLFDETLNGKKEWFVPYESIFMI